MNETVTTLVGNIATDLRRGQSTSGMPIITFRLASTARRFDRGRGGWADLDTLYVTVICWRQLAENVSSSCAKGEPVFATGRLRMRQWKAEDGRSGTAVELEAYAVGHDLNRGTSAFKRSAPRSSAVPTDRAVADDLATQVAQEPLDDPVAGAGSGEAAA